jgi:hypothetical protein
MTSLTSSSAIVTKIHIICGLPGVGKTTYGRMFALKHSCAMLLDIDTCSERLVKAGMALAKLDPSDRDSEVFKSSFRAPIYDTVFQIAQENIGLVSDIVIIGPFTKEIKDPLWPSKLADFLGVSRVCVLVHFICCNSDERRERLIKRNNPRDASKVKSQQDWESHCSYYGTNSEARPVFDHEFVDTSSSLSTDRAAATSTATTTITSSLSKESD